MPARTRCCVCVPAATLPWLQCSNLGDRLRRGPHSHRCACRPCRHHPTSPPDRRRRPDLGRPRTRRRLRRLGVHRRAARRHESQLYRVVPADEPQMFFIQDAASPGFKMILDMAFDAEGQPLRPPALHRPRSGNSAGSPIRVTPDKGQSSICAQYQAGTRTTVLGGLSRPTSVVIGPDGAILRDKQGNRHGDEGRERKNAHRRRGAPLLTTAK